MFPVILCFHCILCSVNSVQVLILSRFVLSAGHKNTIIRFQKLISTITKNAEVHGGLLVVRGGCFVFFVAELCKWAS